MSAKKMMSVAVAGLLVGCIVSSASATPLPWGSAILAGPLPGTAGGTVVGSTGPVAITSSTFTGTLTSTVIRNDPANPFGPGDLTFTYLIHNDATSLHNMERMTLDSFAGFLADASFQASAGSIIPTSFDSSAPAGDVIGVSFTPAPLGSGAITPGASSALLVIQTNATGFSPTIANLIDGSVASVASFAAAPGAGVPEPASLSLAALGGAAMLLRRRRRAS